MPKKSNQRPDASGSYSCELTLSDDQDEHVINCLGYDRATVQFDPNENASYGNVTQHVRMSNDGIVGAAFDIVVSSVAVGMSRLLNITGIKYLHVLNLPSAYPSTGTGVVKINVQFTRKA